MRLKVGRRYIYGLFLSLLMAGYLMGCLTMVFAEVLEGPKMMKIAVINEFFTKEKREVIDSEYIDKNYLYPAFREGVDLFCFPEGFFSTSFKEIIREKAKRYNMYIIAPIMEEDNDGKFYNYALIFNREGEIIGRYDKTHIPYSDYRDFSPLIHKGNKLPVFETEFGKIGVLICYDIYFPQVSQIMALLQGAAVLFNPTAILINPDNEEIRILAKARALDNHVFFVCASDFGWLVIDPSGMEYRDVKILPKIVVVNLDLNFSYTLDEHNRRETLLKHRRPDLYRRYLYKE